MSVCGLLPSVFRPSAAVLLHSSSSSSSSSSTSFSESVESRSSSSSSRPKMDEKDRVNGDRVVFGDADDDKSSLLHHHHTLHGVVYTLIATILFPDHTSPAAGESLLRRAKISFSHNVPLLPQASRNSGRHLLHWTRQGSPLRALLVISVGTIVLIVLTGIMVFMLFFLAATVNAIVISLLMSLAAAGGFLALFFACVTAIYIGALGVAIFFISTATFFTIAGVLVATGWVGFFWTVWLAMKKSMDLVKHSLSATGSAVYTVSRYSR